MVDDTKCELILCNQDIETLMEERENRDSRILKVEIKEDNEKYTDYLNKDLIRDIEVY
jgi:hypothetical protein